MAQGPRFLRAPRGLYDILLWFLLGAARFIKSLRFSLISQNWYYLGEGIDKMINRWKLETAEYFIILPFSLILVLERSVQLIRAAFIEKYTLTRYASSLGSWDMTIQFFNWIDGKWWWSWRWNRNRPRVIKASTRLRRFSGCERTVVDMRPAVCPNRRPTNYLLIRLNCFLARARCDDITN